MWITLGSGLALVVLLWHQNLFHFRPNAHLGHTYEVFVFLTVSFFYKVFLDALSDVGGKAFGCFFIWRFCIAKL